MEIIGCKDLKQKHERGATIVIVAVVLTVLIGVGALAVDLGFAYLQRTNLQKAVDSGSLAGARVLYQNEGQSINAQLAKQHAEEIVQSNINNTEILVEVGHWAFGMGNLVKGFYPSNVSDPEPVDITSYSEVELDENINHINAVRVSASVQSPSFFSRIWNKESITVPAEAVAYVGFAGTLDVYEADVPIVICGESIRWGTDNINCGIGRLIHSGQSSGNSDFNTGSWTNYSSGCEINFNTGNEPSGLQYILSNMEYPDCTAPNDTPITLGGGLSTGGGQSDVGFSEIGECTRFPGFIKNNDSDPREEPWNITVLVVDCEGMNNPSGCLDVVGAVEMSIVLITDTFPSSANQMYNDVPYVMGDFSSENEDGFERWKEFVDHFNLEVLNQTTKEHEVAYDHYYQKTIYAMPECKPAEPKGLSGGQNFGVLAKVPVIVQ